MSMQKICLQVESSIILKTLLHLIAITWKQKHYYTPFFLILFYSLLSKKYLWTEESNYHKIFLEYEYKFFRNTTQQK